MISQFSNYSNHFLHDKSYQKRSVTNSKVASHSTCVNIKARKVFLYFDVLNDLRIFSTCRTRSKAKNHLEKNSFFLLYSNSLFILKFFLYYFEDQHRKKKLSNEISHENRHLTDSQGFFILLVLRLFILVFFSIFFLSLTAKSKKFCHAFRQ